jgi:general stress protein 26
MDPKMRELALRILRETSDLVVATVRPDGWPQVTVVSYVSDGLDIYFIVGRTSQKLQNIKANPKVSIAVDGFTNDWNKIQGLSLAGLATVITDAEGLGHIGGMITKKFPQASGMPMPDPKDIAGIKVEPQVISVLDYTKGFGHTDLVRL